MSVTNMTVQNMISVCYDMGGRENAERCAAFKAIADNCIKDRRSNEDIIRRLAMALLDGMNYGNWPDIVMSNTNRTLNRK